MTIIRNIETLGDRYISKYLSYWQKEELDNNWWGALKFFFGHSFMRGRRDELSNESMLSHYKLNNFNCL